MKLSNHYQTLPHQLYQATQPEKVSNPQLVIFNENLAQSLGFSSNEIANKEQLTNWFSGNQPITDHQTINDSQPIAQAYAGHQFGQLNVLGDGRAVLLGEVTIADKKIIDIQLKGSGRTAYSRNGDGRATLSSMLREYLISEAMFALNIPTTRSLAVVTTGESVVRYDSEYQPNEALGAVLTRTASSHIRVGTFVYAQLMYQDSTDMSILTALTDYSLARHYPTKYIATDTLADKAIKLLASVIQAQAKLVAEWQKIGFVHGVMNTDNITISGETIDYGPCAFMDSYDEDSVFSSIDRQGRYAYGNQMPIMWWNMARFAESLLPLINEDSSLAVELAHEELEKFDDYFQQFWQDIVLAKLGLDTVTSTTATSDAVISNTTTSNTTKRNKDINQQPTEHLNIANKLLALMQNQKLDYTNTFKELTLYLNFLHTNNKRQAEILFTKFKQRGLSEWLATWLAVLDRHNLDQAIKQMQCNNPVVIPRNHLVEEALTHASKNPDTPLTIGDLTTFKQLLAVVQQPYNWSEEFLSVSEAYSQPASSEWTEAYQTFCGT